MKSKKKLLITAGLLLTGASTYAQTTQYSGELEHTKSYFVMQPFSSAYNNGSSARLFYDGNEHTIRYWNSNTNVDYTGIMVGRYRGFDQLSVNIPANASGQGYAGYLTNASIDPAQHVLYLSNQAGAGNLLSAYRNDGANIAFSIKNNGRVGIGTNTPGYDLDVTGVTRSNYLILPSLGQSGAMNASNESGLLYFDDNYQGDYPQIAGNGGGLAIRTEDGWGAVLATNNMAWVRPEFRGADLTESLKIGDAINSPLAGLHVTHTVQGGSVRRAAILGHTELDRTYIGGPYAGFLRGNSESGTLSLEGTYSPGSGRYAQLLFNASNPGNIALAVGGGQVTIGTQSAPAGYDLAIAGKMIAEEVVIELSQNWPDYVFAADYQLRSLPEIEAYIQQNQHLPGVPSADEVAEEGIAVGEMNRVLLEKVEELTLLLIQQNQQQETLKGQLASQQAALEALRSQLETHQP